MSELNLRTELKQVADLYKSGQKSEARRLIGEIVKANPNDADVWYIAGQVLDQSPKKIKAFEQALSINPSHQPARTALNTLRTDNTWNYSDGLFDDYINSPAPSSSYSPQTRPLSQPGRMNYAEPRIVAGILGATLLVGIFLGALCLGTVNSGKFLGIVFAPTSTSSNTPTATATFTPTRTPTATIDIAATTTSLASTQQYFDATSTAQALLREQAFAGTQAAQEFSQTTTAVAAINQQIETAIAATAFVNGQSTPTGTATPFAGVYPTLPPDGTPRMEGNFVPLNFNLVAADYSLALDRIIFVSASPDQMHIYNPATAEDIIIELARAPRSLSIGPDGLFAAVGQQGGIAYVDLQNARVVKTLDVSGEVGEVTLGGNGWVYEVDSSEGWATSWVMIHAINIDSNTEILAGTTNSGAEIQLHPGGTRLYIAQRKVSPTRLTRFDLSDNLLTFAPGGHGQQPRSLWNNDSCGDIWFSPDGLRIFTRCGYVLESSADPIQDMHFIAELFGMDYINALVHIPSIGRILGLSHVQTSLAIWDDTTYATISLSRLPDLAFNGKSYSVKGRYIFANSQGTQYYAVVQGEQNEVSNLFRLLVADLQP